MQQPSSKKVRCPQCQKQTDFTSTNPYRPFCSLRCQQLDLGEWASESYSIPSKELTVSEVEALEEALEQKTRLH